jgi:Flp pilus assembly protein CpaB
VATTSARLDANGASGSGTSTQNGAGGAKPLHRRRGLPGGRAVVGGFLVAAAAVGVFAAYLNATSDPEHSWIVASTEVSVGQQLGPEHLGLIAMDLPPELQDRAFTDPEQVLGAVTTAPLGQYDLLLATHVVDAATGSHDQMSFAVDRARAVAGQLRAGDRVDVLASFGASDETEIVASRLLVLDVDTGEGGLTGRSDMVLTVAVDDDAGALALAHAVNHGALRLVRLAPGEGRGGR